MYSQDSSGASNLIAEVIPVVFEPSSIVSSQRVSFGPITVDNLSNSYYITAGSVDSANNAIPWDVSLLVVSVHIQ